MDHEAAAVGPGQVELRVRVRAAAEEGLAPPPLAQVERVLNGVARLVAQDLEEPIGRAAFDLEGLLLFQARQARVREIEGDRDAGDAVGAEPFPGQPEVRPELQAAAGQLSAQLIQARLERAVLEGHAQVAHPDVEQTLVVVTGPERLGPAGGRGTRRTRRGATGRGGACRGSHLPTVVAARGAGSQVGSA
jgi:hypothetical protein